MTNHDKHYNEFNKKLGPGVEEEGELHLLSRVENTLRSESGVDDADQLYEQSFFDSIGKSAFVFLHPEHNRSEYTEKEMQNLRERDFETRLFVSAFSRRGNSLWVRTHHTDDHEHESNFTYIRDFFKAFYTNRNYTVAKATITTLIATMFEMETDTYHSFATIVASGLSKNGENTAFQIDPSLVNSRILVQEARKQYICMMDVLFRTIAMKEFLIDNSNCNIYRLAHFSRVANNDLWPSLYAVICVMLQLSLATFFTLGLLLNHMVNPNPGPQYIIIGTISSLYSCFAVNREFRYAKLVREIYGRKFDILPMMDLIANLLIPLWLVFVGFFVIAFRSESLSDAVINVTSYLFISEIDDIFPRMLDIDQHAIVKNYLVAKSKLIFNQKINLVFGDKEQFSNVSNTGQTKPISNTKNSRSSKTMISQYFVDYEQTDAIGVQFSDYFITNTPEGGYIYDHRINYQPFKITINAKYKATEVDPINYITTDCLLKEVEFRYTTFNPKTTKPKVGYLRLMKLDGTEATILPKSISATEVGESYTLRGVFIITSFVMTNGIETLRLCGSPTPEEFVQAMEYYSLWKLTSKAKVELLKS